MSMRKVVKLKAEAPVFTLKGGLDTFVAAISAIKDDAESQPVRVTTTNAFASRWLVPRLPRWRKVHPEVPLEVIGIDAVLDLWAGEADIAIRYAHAAPSGVVAEELFSDTFWPVCSPRLFSAESV